MMKPVTGIGMSKHDHLAPPPPRRGRRTWTSPEDYLPNRRRRRPPPRQDPAGKTEPASTARPLLGMVPFMLLMLALGGLAIAIMVAAFPGKARQGARPQVQQQQGTAAPGWLKS